MQKISLFIMINTNTFEYETGRVCFLELGNATDCTNTDLIHFIGVISNY